MMCIDVYIVTPTECPFPGISPPQCKDHHPQAHGYRYSTRDELIRSMKQLKVGVAVPEKKHAEPKWPASRPGIYEEIKVLGSTNHDLLEKTGP